MRSVLLNPGGKTVKRRDLRQDTDRVAVPGAGEPNRDGTRLLVTATRLTGSDVVGHQWYHRTSTRDLPRHPRVDILEISSRYPLDLVEISKRYLTSTLRATARCFIPRPLLCRLPFEFVTPSRSVPSWPLLLLSPLLVLLGSSFEGHVRLLCEASCGPKCMVPVR